MQTYPHRKLSECSHSPAISYYSGTESQQSISDKSIYDNVEVESESRDKVQSPRFLMLPSLALRSSLVNRSKSLQEPAKCRKYLSPRSNITLRRNLTNSIDDRIELISNRSSVSPVGSTRSETNVDCRSCPVDVQNRKLVQPSCSCDRKPRGGPFYVKILRRVRKLSLQWPKCKRVHRG
jgi:CCR4-NOT transcriptional regulation complex NOT5 subunit